MLGRTLSHYKVLAEINRGGMGVVYRALDVKLNREVALKTLPSDLVGNEERKWRFLREAQAAASLKHPNIGVVYEVDEVEGVSFIAMELIEGESLAELLKRGRLSPARILEIAVEVADALSQAHEKGILHRDLKPANVMIGEDGHAKVIDFGLAKLLETRSDAPSSAETALRGETRSGAVMGTVSYMSPEQALGKPLDARSDLFSFGAMLYEMETGRPPFQGQTAASVFDAILHETPTPPRALNPEVPAALETITGKLLEKDPGDRFSSARDLVDALQNVASPESKTTRPRTATLVAAALAVVIALGAVGFWQRTSRTRWAKEVAIPQVARLTEEERYSEAYDLALEAERYAADDPELLQLWLRISRSLTVESSPQGADVFSRDYGAKGAAWTPLGKTPLRDVRIPRAFLHFKLEKPGFQTVEGTGPGFRSSLRDVTLVRTLDEEGSIPSEMVRVEAHDYYPDFVGLDHLESVPLETFFIDRYEVTNRQFQDFADQGGYKNRDYWKHALVDHGKPLSWEEAMTRFVDRTGRPGPAGWELGRYLEGEEDLPVTGVSWYEAAAYAEFAGKELPTIYHWGWAAGAFNTEYVVPWSNYEGDGASPGGVFPNASHMGAYDMAGNVKEWCWNETSRGRYTLGGAWDEPAYALNETDVQDPFERGATFGFRCMKRLPGTEVPEAAARRVEPLFRDFSQTTPVSDDVFAIYRRLFAYDRSDPEPKLEFRDEEAREWVLEKVVIDAAYGEERFAVYVFLPRSANPPFQTVVYFPGSNAIGLRSSDDVRLGPTRGRELNGCISGLDFVMKSGRALVLPIYKGTYERTGDFRSDYPDESASYRDHVVMWGKDLSRTLDYLETRSDLNGRFAFYGCSWGASLGAILPAVETRFRASILASGGLYFNASLPEADPVHYAPRVTVPTLMLNGRHDPWATLEDSQLPMFRLLGTPEEHKRHVLFDSYHTVPRHEGIREVLDWLDTYLGPVS